MNIARILAIFAILLLFSHSASCENNLIWDYEGDHFLENIDSTSSVINEQKKVFLEGEIRKVLDVGVAYTNLTDCILTAAENSYNLKISYHQLRQRVWELRAKTAELLPDITYTFDISKLSGEFLVGGIVPVQVNEIPIKSSFDLIWNITDQGRTIFQMAELNNVKKSSSYNLDYTLDEVLLNTALGYYDLLGKKLEIDVYRVNLQDREEQLKMVRTKFELGLSSKFDIFRAEAEEARAKQEYITLFNTLRYSQAKLANIMGIDVITTLYPSEQVARVQNIIDPKYDVEDLYKIALKERDDLSSKRAEIRSLEIAQKEVYADFIPKVAVTASHAQVGTVRLGLRTNDSIMLEVIQPLGKHLGVNTVLRAQAEKEKVNVQKLNLKQMERKVKEDIIGSYYDSKTQLEKIDAAKKEVISAEESLKVALVRMDIGEATFLDVLQAQAAKIQARQALIQHIINYNKSQVQTLFNIGCISKKAVLVNYIQPSEK